MRANEEPAREVSVESTEPAQYLREGDDVENQHIPQHVIPVLMELDQRSFTDPHQALMSSPELELGLVFLLQFFKDLGLFSFLGAHLFKFGDCHHDAFVTQSESVAHEIEDNNENHENDHDIEDLNFGNQFLTGAHKGVEYHFLFCLTQSQRISGQCVRPVVVEFDPQIFDVARHRFRNISFRQTEFEEFAHVYEVHQQIHFVDDKRHQGGQAVGPLLNCLDIANGLFLGGTICQLGFQVEYVHQQLFLRN